MCNLFLNVQGSFPQVFQLYSSCGQNIIYLHKPQWSLKRISKRLKCFLSRACHLRQSEARLDFYHNLQGDSVGTSRRENGFSILNYAFSHSLSFSPNLSLLLTMVLSSAFCLYEETPSQDLKILWHTCFQIARLPNCQIAKLYLSLFLTNPTFELSAIQSYIMTIFFKLSHSRPLFSFFVSWMQLMVER